MYYTIEELLSAFASDIPSDLDDCTIKEWLHEIELLSYDAIAASNSEQRLLFNHSNH